uniref:Peptidase S1 domain-containing protein n=1 Tax=Acrobeloides nanus TaxID=290746 RepID=A0A914EAR4_9BILA
MGFGKIHDKNGNPIGNNQLYDAEIPLQAPEHCGSTLFHNNETEICAGGFQKGTEEGDSGGPLAIYRTNACSGSQQGTWYLIGITSTGEYELNNGEKNGTKGYDHAYHDWIKEATKGEVTCCGKS